MSPTPETRPEDGASAVEYGLMVAGVAALIVVVVFAFGSTIAGLFTNSCGTIGGHITGASCGP
jgi:pilus assembly protein Flp/PilA